MPAFLGAANVLSGKIESRDPQRGCRIALASGHCLTLVTQQQPGAAVDVVLRPENLSIAAHPPEDQVNTIAGRISALSFQGSNVEYEVAIGDRTWLRVLAPADADLTRDAAVWVGVDVRRAAVFGRAQPAA